VGLCIGRTPGDFPSAEGQRSAGVELNPLVVGGSEKAACCLLRLLLAQCEPGRCRLGALEYWTGVRSGFVEEGS
jgi:hypothetical protein